MNLRAAVVVVVLVVAAVLLWPTSEPLPPPGETETATHSVGAAESVAIDNTEAATANTQRLPAPAQRTEVPSPRRYHKVHGMVMRAGIPQPGRAVVCYRGWGQQQGRKLTDKSGRFEFEVDAANYEILVMPEVGRTLDLAKYRMPVSVHSFLVSARAFARVVDKDVEVRLDLPTKAIVVRVRDAVTMAPVVDATVHWEPPPVVMQELIVFADAAGYVRIADVQPGQHRVIAHARGYGTTEDSVTVEEQGPDGVVELLLEPRYAADIVLLDENRSPVEISAAQKASLVHVATGEVVEAEGPSRRVWPRPKSLAFDNLEPGTYEVKIGGDEYGRDNGVRTIRFAPCVVQGKAKQVLELVKGQLQRAEVLVAQRSYATLRAIGKDGKLLEGTLQVMHISEDGIMVRVLPAPWQYGNRHGNSHFEGYLPRGEYLLNFIGTDGTWSDKLSVKKPVVDRSFTPK